MGIDYMEKIISNTKEATINMCSALQDRIRHGNKSLSELIELYNKLFNILK